MKNTQTRCKNVCGLNRNCVEQVCNDCGDNLGLDVSPTKRYCNLCRKKRDRKYNKIRCGKNYYKRKLRKTYDFLKIPIIQSPYFVEQKKIEVKLRSELR